MLLPVAYVKTLNDGLTIKLEEFGIVSSDFIDKNWTVLWAGAQIQNYIKDLKDEGVPGS